MHIELKNIEQGACQTGNSRFQQYCDVLRHKRDLQRSCQFYRNRSRFVQHVRKQQRKQQLVASGAAKAASDHQLSAFTQKYPVKPNGLTINEQFSHQQIESANPKSRICQTGNTLRRAQSGWIRAQSIRKERIVWSGLLRQNQQQERQCNNFIVQTIRRHRKQLTAVKQELLRNKRNKIQEHIRTKINREQSECRELEEQLRQSRTGYRLR